MRFVYAKTKFHASVIDSDRKTIKIYTIEDAIKERSIDNQIFTDNPIFGIDEYGDFSQEDFLAEILSHYFVEDDDTFCRYIVSITDFCQSDSMQSVTVAALKTQHFDTRPLKEVLMDRANFFISARQRYGTLHFLVNCVFDEIITPTVYDLSAISNLEYTLLENRRQFCGTIIEGKK